VPRLRLASQHFELDVILFDVGGTLLRLDHAFLAACATQRGYALEVASIARGEAQARLEVDRRAAAEGGVRDRDADRIEDYFASVFRAAGVAAEGCEGLATTVASAHRDENLWRVPLDGAAAALENLRARGFRVGAVSNADGRVAALLEKAALAPHLEVILDSHLEGVEKPDPELFRRALARFEVSADRAAYVGDIYAIDAIGARRAGMHPILIDETGSYPPLDCPKIARLSELHGEGPAANR
jgi:putative hydrolase of the HAD superfamily